MDILPRNFEQDVGDTASPLPESERAELARLRSNQHIVWRVLGDAASVLQHARDCVPSEYSRQRCQRQMENCWAAQTLVEREGRR